ncbi:hypothetical protein EJ03DRAFT_354307 [Teratosphaeria nubilosa]|uniref:Uncharacterized protein n=1 Tax=Teratosphaeria nubilosa TaxID=161662 RepID=A0A6G1KZK1_9PEZI|nr:hypothetical protein EJ03DRAFT_354307 [Teratosphaeria nubilosa]
MADTSANNKKSRTNVPRRNNERAAKKATVDRQPKALQPSSVSLSFDKDSLPSIDHITAKSKSALEKVDSNDIEQYSTTTLPLRPVAMETAVSSPSDSVIFLCDKVNPPSDTVTSPFGSADLPSRAHAHLLRREFTKKMGKYRYITYDANTHTYAVNPGFKIVKARNGKDRLVIDGVGGRGGATTADTVRERINANDAVKPTNKEAQAKEMRRLVLLKELQVRRAEAAVGEGEDDFATPSREMVAWVVAPVEGWLSEKA